MNARIPISTYRLQFNCGFRFSDALAIVDYLCELGISDLYASPILKARPGSMHAYDVTDPGQIHPEIGTPEEFGELSRTLRDRDMGLLLDIVPNHMAASLENPWWFDVLENGEASRYAPFFDVNWESKKVLLPILARPYGDVLAQKEIELKVVGGRPVIQYYGQALPVAPGNNRHFSSIDEILSEQHYRLAFWRKAADSINYRRFFDISDLIGLRAEKDEVYNATHALVLKLVEEGKVTGLRIDHIDGLLDPQGYLERLPPVYVTVEKILAGNEQLPRDWRTHGTTGYDFLNSLNGAFIDPSGFRKLEDIYSAFTGSTATATDVFRERKRQVMRELFAGEVNALVNRLSQLAEEDRHARDVPRHDLKEAFVATIANLPVYRTYLGKQGISETDRAIIEDALALVRQERERMQAGQGTSINRDGAVAFLRRVLLLEPAWYLKDRRSEYLDFVMRWQQFTGPVMAKGLEDTTFYVHNPLISVNEVGGDFSGPSVYLGVEAFHRRNLTCQASLPYTMNATSTHDTKRSEDVRARINVLSEVPAEWAAHLRRWTASGKRDPDERAHAIPAPNEQILIYQSMLGAWPIEAGRLKQYVTKALREGKTHSSWLDVNADYERQVHEFIDSLYESAAFLKDFLQFQKKIAYFGGLSSLSQTLLKIASPGIPDFYRGTEVWDLSLADPDNRRPVDFNARIEMLEGLKTRADLHDLLKKWQDGRIKMFVAWKALNCRRTRPALFLDGDYVPLRATGARQDHIVAFARHLRGEWVLAAVPRLAATLTRTGSPPLGSRVWQDTAIEMPADAPSQWSNVFTGESISSPLAAASLFSRFPVCLAVA